LFLLATNLLDPHRRLATADLPNQAAHPNVRVANVDLTTAFLFSSDALQLCGVVSGG
jgi:hypothetical protein